MKTRLAKRKEQVFQGDSSTSTSLDENLWGLLQHHINLAENVYCRLPFEEFFHLRLVCKDWYVIACKRLDLKEQIHKPFFTLLTKGEYGQLDGILFYKALSKSWHYCSRFYRSTLCVEVAASKGVVYSVERYLWGENYARSFHWQSRRYGDPSQPPNLPRIRELTIVGMIVSERRGPYSSFKVVCGSQDLDTLVYESGGWQTKPCRVPKSETGVLPQASTGCADCNGRVYITTEFSREIYVYDFKKARWSILFSPGNWATKLLQHCCLDTLRAWNSRIFDVTCDFESRGKKIWSLQVWELVDEEMHKWQVYDRMPQGLCSWLRSPSGFPDRFHVKDLDISMHASFCGDFMLVYSWDSFHGLAGRCCLFNMATKNWQKLNVAAGTITAISFLPYNTRS